MSDLSRVISFLEGFEGDELQEGIPELIKAAKRADDLLHRNLEAWDDEEDSVKEEHEDLITELNAFLSGSEPQQVFKVTILWGESPEPEDEAKTYTFDTKEELSAFKNGVEEAEGWLGWREVEEGYVVPSEGYEGN